MPVKMEEFPEPRTFYPTLAEWKDLPRYEILHRCHKKLLHSYNCGICKHWGSPKDFLKIFGITQVRSPKYLITTGCPKKMPQDFAYSNNLGHFFWTPCISVLISVMLTTLSPWVLTKQELLKLLPHQSGNPMINPKMRDTTRLILMLW